MKVEMETSDIQAIAEKVAELLGPLLSERIRLPADDILDVAGLAAYLKVRPKWIYERTHLREIPHIKAGGQLRFRKDEIDAWLGSNGIPAMNPVTGLGAIKKTA